MQEPCEVELRGENCLQQLQLQRDCPGAASGLGLQPRLGRLPSKRGMVTLLVVLGMVMLILVLLLGQGKALSPAPECPQLLFHPVFQGTTSTEHAEPALLWGSSAVGVCLKHLQE